MAKRKPVVLQTISFDTQTLALNFFHEMLQRYVPGEQLSPDDAVHLAELFKRQQRAGFLSPVVNQEQPHDTASWIVPIQR